MAEVSVLGSRRAGRHDLGLYLLSMCVLTMASVILVTHLLIVQSTARRMTTESGTAIFDFVLYPKEPVLSVLDKFERLDNENISSTRALSAYQGPSLSDYESTNLPLEPHQEQVTNDHTSEQDKLNWTSSTDTVNKPLYLPKKCKEPHCVEFLTKIDKMHKENCHVSSFRKIQKYLKVNPELVSMKENDCDFMKGTNREPVALVSPPGSGNTWLRGLLERATGYCTGYVTCDYTMLTRGFIGENINSGSVLVVKTHSPKAQWTRGRIANKILRKIARRIGIRTDPGFSSAIVLLRNPYDSLIAEWNRILANHNQLGMQLNNTPHNYFSHTSVASKSNWFSPEWNKFIQSYLSNWLARIKNWILVPSSGHQVLVVKYESLKRDSLTEIERMMTFLRLPFDRETVAKRLAEDFTEFKRPHSKEKDFKRYTDEQILLIRNTVAKAIQLTESTNMTHVLDLNEYMQVFD